MFHLRHHHLFLAAAAATFLSAASAQDSAAQQYAGLSAQLAAGESGLPGRSIALAVDLGPRDADDRVTELGNGREAFRYRMAFNQIAEGWSWQPNADPAVDDYYRFKFLPVQSEWVERGEYAQEDKIGTPQLTHVRWRYDYFLAFDNLYAFYPRQVDDDAGFVAELPAGSSAHLSLRAHLRLAPPVLSESTTFWKATHAHPDDFTLKKRYFVGALTALDFVDQRTGKTWCRIEPGQGRCQAP